MNRALSTRVRTLERKAGVTELSRLSDADLDARMRELSARNAPTFGAGCGSSKAARPGSRTLLVWTWGKSDADIERAIADLCPGLTIS